VPYLCCRRDVRRREGLHAPDLAREAVSFSPHGEPQKLKRYRQYLDSLSERASNLSLLQFFGPIVVACIVYHLAVLVMASKQIGFYHPPLP
jgi:hypothetical protein